MKRNCFTLIAITLLLMVLILVGCTNSTSVSDISESETTESQGTSKPVLLSWSGGTTSGTMYPAGVVMSQVIKDNDSNFNITVEVSAGAVENARNLDSKDSDLGFISRVTAIDAHKGVNMFDVPLDFKMIMKLYSQPMHLVVLADSDIESFSDFVGKRVVIGPAGSANLIENTYALQALGYTPDDYKCLYIKVADGIDALLNGDADALMFVGGAPVSGLMDLGARSKYKILSFTPKEIEKITNSEPFGFTATTIPAGTYEGVDYDVETVSVDMLIGVRSDLEEDIVYRFLDLVLKHSDQMAKGHNALREISADTAYPVGIPVPIHPGALKYYEEHSLIK